MTSLSQCWKLAYVSTVLSNSSQVSDQKFDLDQVKGKLVITKKVIISAFQMVIAKGLTKVTGHQKDVHVLVEPSSKCKNVICSRQYMRINTRGLGVEVVLSKFIWEGYYFRTSHRSWHGHSCQHSSMSKDA